MNNKPAVFAGDGKIPEIPTIPVKPEELIPDAGKYSVRQDRREADEIH